MGKLKEIRRMWTFHERPGQVDPGEIIVTMEASGGIYCACDAARAKNECEHIKVVLEQVKASAKVRSNVFIHAKPKLGRKVAEER